MFRKLIFFFIFAATGSFFAGNFILGKTATKLINMSSRLTAPRFELKLNATKINLLGGVLDLRSLSVKNREAENSNFYFLKRLFADIDTRKLLSRKLVIERIEATDAKLLFVKHGQDQNPQATNSPNIDEQSQPSENKPQQEQQKQVADREQAKEKEQPQKQDQQNDSKEFDYTKIAQFLLERLDVSALIEFEDKTVEPRFKQGLKIRLKAKNLSTYPVPGTKAGTIAIMGALESNSSLFLIKAKATVPPMKNPRRPDFDLEATINRVDIDIFKPYLQDSGLTDGTMEIAVKLVCRDGEFVRAQSNIQTRISKIKFSEETLSRMPKEVKIPNKLEFTAHVYGPLTEPRTDFAASLAGVIIKKVFRSSLTELIQKQINK